MREYKKNKIEKGINQNSEIVKTREFRGFFAVLGVEGSNPKQRYLLYFTNILQDLVNL
ncbi:hypothetical protein SPACI_039640 [Sporomusa acidovorans DSM 3132]|uniref:Uncharacterized protein n=1 Tax=Sporomusa acidovorans (strain ATCC 49682 / DSM 3132 / Mol) TaxID=1123286 RepID=A0ABZ3J7K8_SPOA4|nr:hypothetical protein SPACI_33840 [Sporomusa acidovorans DSM 3132]SDE37092.1 hypothetical protein SAMN04488499_101254 [Sporomusa acidovorans]